MRDLSYLLGLFGVLFLVLAVLAWSRILHKPDEQPPSESNTKRSNSAAMVIFIALLLSAVAAFVAVLGWFQR